MPSILPIRIRFKVAPNANSANLMLDEPPLMASTQGMDAFMIQRILNTTVCFFRSSRSGIVG